MRILRHIAQPKGKGITLLLTLLFVCISFSSNAQVNPFARELRSKRTIVRAGQIYTPDSLEVRRNDSLRVAKLADTLRKLSPDSLAKVGEIVRKQLPDSLRKEIFGAPKLDSLAVDSLKRDSLKIDSTLTERQRKRIEKRENRTPYFSDSMSYRRFTLTSAVLPGYGQIYNKQYWKLPILYSTLGASLGMCIWSDTKYKPLKAQYESITDQSLLRTPELNALQSEMIKYNTMRQAFMITTIASYVYFLGDAAVKYATSEVSPVNRATTLALICPGAGQIYNKSYWRVPIVVGGFATTIYCIDWNNRGYQRFKKAYRLKADYDANSQLYPNGSPDEFAGRYNTSFLKNLRNSYRRNRDLCIILTAGLYILQAVDAHVDAHLQSYDISKDLSVSLTPAIGYSYNRMAPYSGGGTTLGMNLNFTF
ncbi:MAG: hypothetical protein IKA07_00325 [Alistipes sp.]|nr:hypothetical protein [Alistipes sp.]